MADAHMIQGSTVTYLWKEKEEINKLFSRAIAVTTVTIAAAATYKSQRANTDAS